MSTSLISKIPDEKKKYRADAYFCAVETYEMEGEITPPADDILGTDSEIDWMQGMRDAEEFSAVRKRDSPMDKTTETELRKVARETYEQALIGRPHMPAPDEPEGQRKIDRLFDILSRALA